MTTSVAIAAALFGAMLVESVISRRHERALRERGAIEPAGDVYRAMQVAYPAAFLLMLLESLVRGAPPARSLQAGAVVILIAKALKYWAMATLGPRWSFRVLVLRDTPLIDRGPYRFLRHPNYVAVVGEFVGAALLFGAPLSGAASTLGFGALLRRRIAVEERAHAAG